MIVQDRKMLFISDFVDEHFLNHQISTISHDTRALIAAFGADGFVVLGWSILNLEASPIRSLFSIRD